MVRGFLDSFLPPDHLSGWVFCDNMPGLRIRAIVGSSILGEAKVERARPDLLHFGNNGNFGWLIKAKRILSPDEIISGAIKFVVLNEADQIIGFLPVLEELSKKMLAALPLNAGQNDNPIPLPDKPTAADFKADNKTAVLILGMHRSGTSALTRMINLLGMALPAHLMEAGPANETGYWESVELRLIHDEILMLLKSSWDDILPLDEQWQQSTVADYYKKVLADYLVREFSGVRHFVLKDPRLCKLVPLWLEVLASLNVGVKVIIPFRNPLEVAKSLQQREGFLPERSFLLWLRHVIDAERHTRKMPRCFLSYTQLLNDQQQTINQIAGQCKLDLPNCSDSALTEIAGFISPDYYHQRAKADELASAQAPDWVIQAYDALNTLIPDGNDTRSIKKFNKIAGSMQQANRLCQVVLAEKEREFQRVINIYRHKQALTLQHARHIQQLAQSEDTL